MKSQRQLLRILQVMAVVVLSAGCTEVIYHGSCGNGTVDEGEECDGNCPVSCDDQNDCTLDTRSGHPQNCDVTCINQPIGSCIDNDGCCPESCDTANDLDCQPKCGNSKIEEGESCDPPSTCPTDCHADDPCQVGHLRGSSADCNAECEIETILKCSAETKDGCCPELCHSHNDVDCQSVCGNEIVEEEETCDPPSGCPEQCADGDPCTVDIMQGRPENCNVRCVYEVITKCNLEQSDECCPETCHAETDQDCSRTCGNEVLDEGETCDPPAIECIAVCHHEEDCLLPVLSGRHDTCNRTCGYRVLTGCEHHDGCCPAGCFTEIDMDCK